MQRYTILILMIVLAAAGCKKYKDDPAGETDFNSTYCNDPLAVNYNWGFPGTPDNSICVYPKDLFEGDYILTDSVYYYDFTLEKVVTRKVSISAYDLTHLNIAIDSLCSNTSKTSLPFTADRFYKATIDSVKRTDDSTLLPGRPICNSDTISGFVLKNRSDSNSIRINFTVLGDTGRVTFHVGTAIKQ